MKKKLSIFDYIKTFFFNLMVHFFIFYSRENSPRIDPIHGEILGECNCHFFKTLAEEVLGEFSLEFQRE